MAVARNCREYNALHPCSDLGPHYVLDPNMFGANIANEKCCALTCEGWLLSVDESGTCAGFDSALQSVPGTFDDVPGIGEDYKTFCCESATTGTSDPGANVNCKWV